MKREYKVYIKTMDNKLKTALKTKNYDEAETKMNRLIDNGHDAFIWEV